jgi:hypothetical protein
MVGFILVIDEIEEFSNKTYKKKLLLQQKEKYQGIRISLGLIPDPVEPPGGLGLSLRPPPFPG